MLRRPNAGAGGTKLCTGGAMQATFLKGRVAYRSERGIGGGALFSTWRRVGRGTMDSRGGIVVCDENSRGVYASP